MSPAFLRGREILELFGLVCGMSACAWFSYLFFWAILYGPFVVMEPNPLIIRAELVLDAAGAVALIVTTALLLLEVRRRTA